MKLNLGFLIFALSIATITGFSSISYAAYTGDRYIGDQGYNHVHHKHHKKNHKHHGHNRGCYKHQNKSRCANNKVSKPCCTTARMRFEQCTDCYAAGCRAAQSYVSGRISGHSKAWNEGFTDCRFNVYRSDATEIKAEKTICGYSHCCH